MVLRASHKQKNKLGEVPFPPLVLTRMLSDDEVRERVSEIDPLTLESVPLDQVRSLPHESGVYFFIRNESVVYVGQTCRLASRCRNHKQAKPLIGQLGVRIAFIVIPGLSYQGYFRTQVERYFINKFRPVLNKHRRGKRDELLIRYASC